MILLDFSGVIFASLHVDLKDNNKPNKDYIRHLCMNTIRFYNHKFRHEYGNLFLCFDSRSWRGKLFPDYKWVRQNDRDNSVSDIDWGEVWEIFSSIQEELTEHLPMPTIEALGAEADDIIAVLAKQSNEPVVIVSNDKDFVFLTKLDHVKQYRPYNNLFYTVDDPVRYEFELFVSGDKVDGVPSIKCADSFLRRQWILKHHGRKPPRAPMISKKFKDMLWVAYNNGTLKAKLDELGLTKRYLRNRTLISLDCVPDNIVNNINIAYDNIKYNSQAKLIAYMRTYKMNLLASKLDDFRMVSYKPSIF